MKKLICLATLLACTSLTGYARADDAAPSLAGDSRIKLLHYDEGDVYTIATKYGYQTNIVFAPNESIETISVGDRSLWQIIPSANRLFIRPMEENVTTNMTILTNKRSYQFDLKSVGEKQESNIYVAKFVYEDAAGGGWHPQPMPAMKPPPAAAPVILSAPVAATPGAPAQPNYNYTYTGPDELAPLKVYDDGASTFIQYRDVSKGLPDVYVVGEGGKETLTNISIQGETMVVPAVAKQLLLKSSKGTLTVYNETLNPR